MYNLFLKYNRLKNMNRKYSKLKYVRFQMSQGMDVGQNGHE